MENETEVMFDYEKSLWDNVILQTLHIYEGGFLTAIEAANEVIKARRKLFNNQGEV